jgi:hypothetical protein
MVIKSMPSIGPVKILAKFDRKEDPGSPGFERLWALYVGDGLAKVDNVPAMASEVSLGDTVRINEDLEIVEVIEKAAISRLIRWEAVADDENLATIIVQYFKRNFVIAEYSCPGMAALAVPLDMRDEGFERICSLCPVAIRVYEGTGDLTGD